MRHICSGEDVCGMVVKDDQGHLVSVNDHMGACHSARHCGLVRMSVSYEHGEDRKKEKRREESLYQLRMLPMFKEETKGEFLNRMRRAEKGAYERKPMMRMQ